MENPHHHVLFVPVRSTASGSTALRIFMRPDGVRTGVAFSSAGQLQLTLGAAQDYIVVGASALRSMLCVVGVTGVQLDPDLVIASAPHDRAVS